MLQFAVQVLQQFTTVEDHTLSKDDRALLSNFLLLTSQVLNWDFRPQLRFFRTSTEAVNVILRPPRSYAPTFLDAGFLALFFKLLSLVHSDEDDFHVVVQCLTQLASLTRPVFATEKEQQEYLVVFVARLLEYIQSRYMELGLFFERKKNTANQAVVVVTVVVWYQQQHSSSSSSSSSSTAVVVVMMVVATTAAV